MRPDLHVPRGNAAPPPGIVEQTARSFSEASRALGPMRLGATLVLGCSVGGDSMALLDLAAHVRPAMQWRLSVAHLDHAQRPGSEAEVDFISRRCATLEIPLITERLTTGTEMSEAEMRGARYAFYRRAAAHSGAGAVVLAHQADDRAETFLMRLLSGSGPTGLSSIRALDVVDGLCIARPLLGLRRELLREYLRARGLEWFEDPSNENIDFKRAWIRRRVLPLFSERMGDAVVPRIVRASELVEEESSALSEACARLLDEIAAPAVLPAVSQLLLGHALWVGASEALRRRLIREWLWKLRRDHSPHPPGYAAVDEALKFAERGARGSELRTVERIHLVKVEGRLVAYPPEVGPEARATR